MSPLVAQIQPAIQSMARWAVGFAVASAIYFAVGLWVIRRVRQKKSVEASVKEDGPATPKP